MDSRYFSDKIVEWYEDNRRKLPWRETKDPYKIWLSEIILQQTRVNQGLPFYQRFIKTYPVIAELAKAKEQDILRLWQGLGYYTRARNLHKCAKAIIKEHKGVFPSSYNELKKLPGIGDYTAAAIASIAFNEPVAVVDGNVFRVLSRVFGVEKDISSPEGKKFFFDLANKVIDRQHPEKHNQAVMEFGALHCTPKQPLCDNCIFENTCVASKRGIQHELPVKAKLRQSRKRYFYYFVIGDGDSFAMKKRIHRDIWSGLYDFYLIEKKRPTQVRKIMEEDELLAKFGDKECKVHISPTYRHILSHQTILAKFITLLPGKIKFSNPSALRFYSKKRIYNLPKPVLINKFLTDRNIL